MLQVSDVQENPVLKGTWFVPVLSHVEFTSTISKMELNAPYVITPNKTVCFVTPRVGATDFILLHVESYINGDLKPIMSLGTASRNDTNIMTLLEEKEVVETIGLSAILTEVNTILGKFK